MSTRSAIAWSALEERRREIFETRLPCLPRFGREWTDFVQCYHHRWPALDITDDIGWMRIRRHGDYPPCQQHRDFLLCLDALQKRWPEHFQSDADRGLWASPTGWFACQSLLVAHNYCRAPDKRSAFIPHLTKHGDVPQHPQHRSTRFADLVEALLACASPVIVVALRESCDEGAGVRQLANMILDKRKEART